MEKREMAAGAETSKRFPRRSGGHLGLDFVNTVEPRIGDAPHDFLSSYADLAKWSHHVGLITEERAERLVRVAGEQPESSQAIFNQAIALREASYRVFRALIEQQTPASTDLELLQNLFVQTLARGRLVPTHKHIDWQWQPREDELDQILSPLNRAIMELLTSSDIGRIKECPHTEGGCGWLFVDKSKNRSRRWCSDEECGSLIRMRRMYARKRANRKQF